MFVTRLKRRVPLVRQELLTLPENQSPPPVFSGVRVTRSLFLCECFVDRCLSFCTFSFGHCVVCFSSIHILITPLVSSAISWREQILLLTWTPTSHLEIKQLDHMYKLKKY